MKPWPKGASAYYWYLTFENDSLAAAANACQVALEEFDLRPVPTGCLHMTLLRVGPPDVVSNSMLERIITNAAEELGSTYQFQLDVGPLTGSAGAIRFSVTPWSPVLDLVEQLRRAQGIVLNTNSAKPQKDLRPHIGIAYSSARQPITKIRETVSELRTLAPVPTVVNAVKLVRLWRTETAYEWEEQASIPLRRAGPGRPPH
ncbi:2'-5' RNA ligase family protein [Nocardia camponoti]|uniref:2'-5' RNA ligase family protein n=1 Tax=Nocardia camponoti TaxID=1616106 RepID=UPI00166E40AD|nr:2'-5' RNA ligase family protein [Nocardia camponoti]